MATGTLLIAWALVGGAASHQERLFDAVTRGDERAVAEGLAQPGALTVVNEHGYSLLHWAVLTRQPRIAALLVARGASVRAATPDGRTILHDAAFAGDDSIVRMLLDAGARAYATDTRGQSPLDVAIQHGHTALFSRLAPLHRAAAEGDEASARRTLEAEPDSVNARDESGASALHRAAAAGHLSVVTLLATRRADLDARAACGETPLRLAIEGGRRDVVEFLRSQGAPDRSDRLLLDAPLPEGQAVMWHLFDVGWVVRTARHVLVFDYVPSTREGLPPGVRPCLSSGEFDPAHVASRQVVVFASFLRDQRHRDALWSWKKALPTVTYVVGDANGMDMAAIRLPPRTERQVAGLQVLAFKTTGYGQGFLVSGDGLTILYGGDHQSSEGLWPAFVHEVDFVRQRVPRVDIAFLQMMFGRQMASNTGVLYALERLRPTALFSSSIVAGESFFTRLVEDAARTGSPARVESPRRRGDLFLFPAVRMAGAGRQSGLGSPPCQGR